MCVPQRNSDTREQFGSTEWLGKVVISPGIKNGNFVGITISDGQDDNWN